jgi:hypothetical protein
MHPLKLGVKLEFIYKNDLSPTQNHILHSNQLGTPLKTSFLVPQDYFTRSANSRRRDSSPLEELQQFQKRDVLNDQRNGHSLIMNLVDDNDFQPKNPITLMFNVGVFVPHYVPPCFSCHDIRHVITSYLYHLFEYCLLLFCPPLLKISFVPTNNISPS